MGKFRGRKESSEESHEGIFYPKGHITSKTFHLNSGKFNTCLRLIKSSMIDAVALAGDYDCDVLCFTGPFSPVCPQR